MKERIKGRKNFPTEEVDPNNFIPDDDVKKMVENIENVEFNQNDFDKLYNCVHCGECETEMDRILLKQKFIEGGNIFEGLDELIELICAEEIDRIVINYKDRIIRFGYEIITKLCDIYNVEIEVINHTEDKEYKEELLEDVLSIITDFSCKLYGNRSQRTIMIKKESSDLFKKTGA